MDTLNALYDPETFRRQGHALIDLLADYLTAVQRQTEQTVIPWQTPADAWAYWQNDAAQPPNPNPIALFADILAKSNHLHHPRYMGHQVPPPAPLAALAGLATELLNNGMAVYEMGLVSNPMERYVTELLCQRIGYATDSGGVLTSGGTLANLTALLAARAMRAPSDVWADGHSERLAIMVGEEAHYCIDRAARIMGLGSDGIILVPCDKQFKLRTDLLETYYEQARAKGLHVFCVVGSASSTSTGAHDDLSAVADFAEKHGIWFHADAAHGGGAVFSKRYRALLTGIERADSVVVDFHKMLLTPALATAVVYKRGMDGYRSFQQKAQYLWADQTSQDWYNSGKRTFECTKYMMATKIYTLLRTCGESVFEENIDRLYDLGRQFAEMLREQADFELAYEPECNIVCFRYVAPNGADCSPLNATIRVNLIEQGGFYIVQTQLKGETWLRVALMNPLTTGKDLDALLRAIRAIASQIVNP
jgi:L-2,4-diaminobutyrate decarboxylase